MEQLHPDDLYDERGFVTWCRPILQGDVFRDILVPGFGDDLHTVQILTHPCSMRRGTHLNERTQVAQVVPHNKVKDWNTHGRVMPLPDLREDGRHFATLFVDQTAVPTASLTPMKRIASLSHSGIYALQQRLVKHLTRIELDIADFREQSRPVLVESEIQENWVETRIGATTPTPEMVNAAAADFQAWLDEDDGARRKDLANEANHARLRREARAAARTDDAADA